MPDIEKYESLLNEYWDCAYQLGKQCVDSDFSNDDGLRMRCGEVRRELEQHVLASLERTPQPGVSDAMVDRACEAHWPGSWPGDRPEDILVARRSDMRAALEAAIAPTPDATNGGGAREWRCFHCDEAFTSEHEARQHFGCDEGDTPACQIKGSEHGLVEALRRAEKDAADAWFAIQNETTDAAKAYHAQVARHQQQLRAVEQIGYDRGIADAKAHPETLGLTTPTPSAQPDAGDGVEIAGYIVERNGRYCGFWQESSLTEADAAVGFTETPLVRQSDYTAVCQERDQVRAELGTDLIRTEARAQQAEQEIKRLGEALEKIASRHVTIRPLWWQAEARRALNPSEGR